jgi:two-component system chemotaxis response regulator CheB
MKAFRMKYEAIVIGVSAGGMKALKTIFSSLLPDFALPVIIAQHRYPGTDNYLEKILDAQCQITVRQAEEKEKIEPGIIFIAPSNYHLLVEDDRTFSMSLEGRVNFARPSIDLLFNSAADVYGPKLIGIILTGANNDGSKGLKTIKERGGLTIVQDPETAEADSMPMAAIAKTKVDYIISLYEIGNFLNKIACGKDVRKD